MQCMKTYKHEAELYHCWWFLHWPMINIKCCYNSIKEHKFLRFPLSQSLFYAWTSLPVDIKDAAGQREEVIFHLKMEGSHLITEGRGKSLAGQQERSRTDQAVSLPHHIISVWQHHPKVEVHQDFSWMECLTSNTRLKWGCRILAGPNENINC